MNILKKLTLTILTSALIASCATGKLKTYDVLKPSDTSNREISYQEKKIFSPDEVVYADNQFLGARLNSFEKLNDSTYQATILPENEPINQSPNYAFQIWSKTEKEIYLKLNYPTSVHRYWPKISDNRIHWYPVDSTRFKLVDSVQNAMLKLKISPKKQWVSAQEIWNSDDNKQWSETTSNHENVRYSVIGKSKLGKDIIALDIYKDSPKKKDMIVAVSRQHPPEVTGYLAMQSFVEELLSDTRLSKDFLEKHRILVVPMINPDGVDLGHWRHSTGGVDLNRDWAYYKQTEVDVVVNYLVNESNKYKNKVLFGIDFHSTQTDLYYTIPEETKSVIHPFKDYWIQGIDDAFEGYTPDDQPYALEQPVSKTWFYKQFGAEAMTYEIGDETPRDFIDAKARVAAKEMMKLLILR